MNVAADGGGVGLCGLVFFAVLVIANCFHLIVIVLVVILVVG